MTEPKPITLNLTLKELQQIDKYVEVNDDTLSVLMKIKDAYPPQKSPAEIAYKDWWGEYPGTEIWTKDDEMRWVSFSAGYYASQEPKKEQKWDVVRESVKWCKEHPDESVEDYLTPQGPQGPVGPGPGPKGVIVGYEPTPQTPDKIEENLREAFKKVQQTEEWKETQRKIDSNYEKKVEEEPKPMNEVLDRLENKYKDAEENAASYITDEVVNIMLKKWEENPPDFLKFELGKTLEELICKCMVDYNSIIPVGLLEDILNNIEEWLPDFQSHEGTQSASVIDLVDGYNDALTKIKSKLRNKKDT